MSKKEEKKTLRRFSMLSRLFAY